MLYERLSVLMWSSSVAVGRVVPFLYRLQHQSVLFDARLQLVLLGEQRQQAIAFGDLGDDHDGVCLDCDLELFFFFLVAMLLLEAGFG